MNLAYAAVWLIVTAALVVYTLRLAAPGRWVGVAAFAGIAFFFAASIAGAAGVPYPPADFRSFWTTGALVLQGVDPILGMSERPLPPLNPPTAFPIFAAFALAPWNAAFVAWTAVSATLCVALTPLSRLVIEGRGESYNLDRPGVALVAAAFVLSNAPRSMLQSGQLAAVVALGLIVALAAQAKGRPFAAGAAFVLGSVKPNTLLPFGLLFLRRRDLATWVAVAVFTAAVCLETGRALDAPRRAREYVAAVQSFNAPGRVNDVTFDGPATPGMVGADYALYRLGFRSARSAAAAQIAALTLIGAALARRVLRRGVELPTGGDCAQVALYSTVFLYHRTHDFVVLALPLTHAVGRARAAAGRARWAFAAAAAAMVGALAHQRKLVEWLEAAVRHRSDPAAWLVQAAVLPHATWLVLLAMFALALAERWADAPGGGVVGR
jgi:hypothetical protein